LAKGLRALGHEVFIVRPRFGPEPSGDETRNGRNGYDGFEPVRFDAWAPRVPFVRNYFKNERLYRSLEPFLAGIVQRDAIDIVHAQHLLTGPPSIAAARSVAVPVVCTVRDYWPVCYWSDLIQDRGHETLCPGCSVEGMTRCVRPHAGALWPAALPFIPYMRANLSLKRRSLAHADAIIAVSGAIAQDLRLRAPELNAARIETIHNPVDVSGIRALAHGSRRPMEGPYATFVGKLEPNKGVSKLLTAVDRASLDWPVVVVGDGSERPRLEAEASRLGRDVRFVGWRPRHDVLSWLQHADLLVFPSAGPESLSRVLLEASALGTPIAAMDTGGTKDIVVDEETGLLSSTAEELGDDVARLRRDEALRARLGDAARKRIERRFDSTIVTRRVEELYTELIDRAATARDSKSAHKT
jgi:glycosyltransferase involved in cell wall biosynthesis